MLNEDEVERLTKDVLDAEYAARFPLIRRVPSTRTWKILDYVAALQPADRDSLFDAFASNGAFLLWPGRDSGLHAYQAGHPAYRRFVDTMPMLSDWKYADVRYLRGVLSDVRSPNPSPEFASVPAEVLERAASIKPTNAVAIRREVKSAFARRFGAKPENRGGGDWAYAGEYLGRTFQVRLDYGGRSDQLIYGVSYDDAATGIRARRLSYEGLIGFGNGQWDFVTDDNLAESVRLLGDLIERLVVLPATAPRG